MQAFQISVKISMCLGLWVLLQWNTRHLEEGSSECEEYRLHRGNSVPQYCIPLKCVMHASVLGCVLIGSSD